MFDIGATELLLIVIVAVVVIGPKDLPRALRLAGRWISKVRRTSNHFRAGIETMIREAEMEEMEKKWREQNARIMAEHPQSDSAGQEWQSPPSAESVTAEGVTAEAGAPPSPVPAAEDTSHRPPP
jgi:sec-independent protein translocase protein TatB